MKRSVVLAAVGLLLTGAFPQSAAACSWGYKPGHSPEDIKRRTDVIVIEAKYRLEEMRGEPGINEEGEEVLFNPEVVGHIEMGARRWPTIHEPQLEWATCILPAKGPAADASGTFWITERREHGRYRILYWEGEYLQPEQTEAAPTE